MKKIIFDFDGVISTNPKYLAKFLSEYIPFLSYEGANRLIIKSALHNTHLNFITSALRGLGSKLFLNFLQKELKGKDILQELGIKLDLIDFIERNQVESIILTSNYKSIVEFSLGDKSKLFSYIAGFDDYHSKTSAIVDLSKKGLINVNEDLFISDTVGDIIEFKKIANLKNIYAVDWGFHERYLLLKELDKTEVLSSVSELENILTKPEM